MKARLYACCIVSCNVFYVYVLAYVPLYCRAYVLCINDVFFVYLLRIRSVDDFVYGMLHYVRI